ncbi:hypothetical protein ACH4JS_23435 [Streptomyces sp. NPDC017638]|uniref:hypothetical protein n=1 Tax=Streptomyces sp. NPDC017638 TaxID=3365004 RepID=UPI003794B7D9
MRTVLELPQVLAQRLRSGDHFEELSGVVPAQRLPVGVDQPGGLRPGPVDGVRTVLDPRQQSRAGRDGPVRPRGAVHGHGEALDGQ